MTSVARSRALKALVATGALLVLAGCATDDPTVPRKVTEGLDSVGITHAEVASEVVAETRTVTVTTDAPLDRDGARGAARVVWQGVPGRVDSVVVRSARGGEQRFDHLELVDDFGERPSELGNALPSSSDGPGLLLPAAVVLFLAGTGAFLFRRSKRRAGDEDQEDDRRAPDMASINPAFVLGTETGLTARWAMTTAALGPTADAEGDPEAVEGAPGAASELATSGGASVTTADVIDLGAVLGQAGVSQIYITGRWALRALQADGPDPSGPLELLVGEDQVATVVAELSALGFHSGWHRDRRGPSRVRLVDHRGRHIEVTPALLVDDPAPGEEPQAPRAEEALGVLLPRSAVTTGTLGSVQVPCVLQTVTAMGNKRIHRRTAAASV